MLDAIKKDIERDDLVAASDKCLVLLRRDPTNVPAIELYAEIAIRKHRLTDAMLILKKLLSVAPRNIYAHQQLASLYESTGDFYHAIGHARAALEIDAGLVEPYIVLGSIAMAQGHTEDGAAEFARARKLSANNLPIELAYTDALILAGKFDEAAQILRGLIGQYPDEIRLYLTLSRAKRFQAGDGDIALLRSLLDQKGELRDAFLDSPNDSALAYMALFKLESDLENTAGAFKFLQLAKQIRKQGIVYDAREAAEKIASGLRVFDQEFVRDHLGVGHECDAPIFIVGMPRSGTTLLERIISSEENVAAGGELTIIPELLEETCAAYGKNQYDLKCLPHLSEDLWRELGKEYVVRARRQMPDSRYFVDKNVGNFFHVGFIKTILPRATIIHSVRHPLATCLSIYEQDFAHAHYYSYDLSWLAQMYLSYRQAMDHWHRLYPGQIIDVHYEQLVNNKKEYTDWLLGQLGLEGSRDLAKSQASGVIRTASMWQARQPVYTQSIARWEKYREQLDPLLEALAPILSDEELR